MTAPAEAGSTWRSRTLIAAGLFCLAAAFLLPDRWYQPLPPIGDVPLPPVSGWWLLRGVLGLDAVVFMAAGWRRIAFTPVPASGRLSLSRDPGSDRTPHWAWWLGAITLVGVVLRLWAIGTSLWLDEITPLLNYHDVSAWQVVTNYVSSNNHLLNTLLVKLTTSMFGEVEWAIRLPAVAFGAATVPAMYWVARAMLPRRASLLAALILAVSYHHIFFSQDARGYTAYLLTALVASGLFVRLLEEDRLRLWIAYSVTMTVGLAALLISAFVLAAHGLVGLVALAVIRSRGGPVRPMLLRLAALLALTGYLGLHLYVVALPQIYAYMGAVYADRAAGFPALSTELLREFARGLSAGFGVALAVVAVPAALVAGVGTVRLVRRNWPLLLSLALPPILQLAFAIARGLVVSPRFFLLLLPLAILVVIAGVDEVATRLGRRLSWPSASAGRLTVAVVSLAALASIAALPAYYATPKQPYREAVAWLDAARAPGDAILAIQNAQSGVEFYGRRIGWKEGTDFVAVRSVSALDEQVAAHPHGVVWLMVTFPRALRIDLPELDARIRAKWTEVRQLRGTIGDGDITIWRRPAGTH
jgi:mannosyltransferase